MKEARYCIDIDVLVSKEKDHLQLFRNGKLIETLTGSEAKKMNQVRCVIDDLTAMGFVYCFLDFDGEFDEWYELHLREQTRWNDSVTLVYNPEKNELKIEEQDFVISDLKILDKVIKIYKS